VIVYVEQPIVVLPLCEVCFSTLEGDHCGFCGWVAPKKPAPPATPRVRLVAGLDLGQLQDYTALVLGKQTKDADGERFDVVSLHRFELGTSYVAIVAKVKEWLTKPPWNTAPLIADQTGVGRAVIDMFREAGMPGPLVPVTITAGRAVTPAGGGSWHVAKVQLVSTLQALLSGRRLGIPAQLPEAAVLTRELKHFRAKVTPAGTETFESWRERAHDDFVLGLALAAWYVEARREARIICL
jgi:hypothetical protein